MHARRHRLAKAATQAARSAKLEKAAALQRDRERQAELAATGHHAATARAGESPREFTGMTAHGAHGMHMGGIRTEPVSYDTESTATDGDSPRSPRSPTSPISPSAAPGDVSRALGAANDCAEHPDSPTGGTNARELRHGYGLYSFTGGLSSGASGLVQMGKKVRRRTVWTIHRVAPNQIRCRRPTFSGRGRCCAVGPLPVLGALCRRGLSSNSGSGKAIRPRAVRVPLGSRSGVCPADARALRPRPLETTKSTRRPFPVSQRSTTRPSLLRSVGRSSRRRRTPLQTTFPP